MFLGAQLSPQMRHFHSIFTQRSAKSIKDHVHRSFNNLNSTVHPVPTSFFSSYVRRRAELPSGHTGSINIEPNDVGLPPEIPEYERLALKIKGYDFTVLEKFAKYVHGLCTQQFRAECYPVPCKSIHVNTYRPNSTIIDKTYNLELYERVVVVNDLPNTKLTSLIYALTLHTPEGVNFTVEYPSPGDEENRYIPDRQLVELHGQLEDIAIKKKKK